MPTVCSSHAGREFTLCDLLGGRAAAEHFGKEETPGCRQNFQTFQFHTVSVACAKVVRVTGNSLVIIAFSGHVV